jgi:hypothetical protein
MQIHPPAPRSVSRRGLSFHGFGKGEFGFGEVVHLSQRPDGAQVFFGVIPSIPLRSMLG